MYIFPHNILIKACFKADASFCSSCLTATSIELKPQYRINSRRRRELGMVATSMVGNSGIWICKIFTTSGEEMAGL